MTTYNLNIEPFSGDLPIMVLRLKRLLLRHSAGIIDELLTPTVEKLFSAILVCESIPMPGSWRVDIRRRYQLDNGYVLSMQVYHEDDVDMDDGMSIHMLKGTRISLAKLFDVETTPFNDLEVEDELMEFLNDYVFGEVDV